MRKTVKLTAARHAHAASRKVAPQFKGTPLRNNAGVESRYVEALQALCAQMTAQVKREVLRLFRTEHAGAHFAQDAPNIGPQARILVNSLNQRFNALFAKRAPQLAGQMVEGAQAASK